MFKRNDRSHKWGCWLVFIVSFRVSCQRISWNWWLFHHKALTSGKTPSFWFFWFVDIWKWNMKHSWGVGFKARSSTVRALGLNSQSLTPSLAVWLRLNDSTYLNLAFSIREIEKTIPTLQVCGEDSQKRERMLSPQASRNDEFFLAGRFWSSLCLSCTVGFFWSQFSFHKKMALH